MSTELQNLISDLRAVLVRHDPSLSAEERDFLLGETRPTLPETKDEDPEYREDGFTVETSFLGGRRHILVDRAVEELVERAENREPYAQQALDQVRWWFIFPSSHHPEMKPLDPLENQRASAGLSANYGLAIAGIRSADYNANRVRKLYGIEDIDQAPEDEGPSRTRVIWTAPGADLVKIMQNTAKTLRESPQLLARVDRERREEEESGNIRPLPSPLPPSRP